MRWRHSALLPSLTAFVLCHPYIFYGHPLFFHGCVCKNVPPPCTLPAPSTASATDIAAAFTPSVITLYPVLNADLTVRKSGGNLGGRAGADKLCAESPNRPVSAFERVVPTQYRALISPGPNDEVQDFVAR